MVQGPSRHRNVRIGPVSNTEGTSTDVRDATAGLYPETAPPR